MKMIVFEISQVFHKICNRSCLIAGSTFRVPKRCSNLSWLLSYFNTNKFVWISCWKIKIKILIAFSGWTLNLKIYLVKFLYIVQLAFSLP